MLHKITDKQHNSRMCFICGLKNQFGLHAHFYVTEGKELIAVCKPSEIHQSYPGRLHGGVSSALLDETIGRAILNHHQTEIWGVTIELTLKYKKGIPLDEEIKIVGRINSENNRSFEGTGEIYLANGEIAVTAFGKYLKVPLDKISDFDRDSNEWKVIHLDSDPKEILI